MIICIVLTQFVIPRFFCCSNVDCSLPNSGNCFFNTAQAALMIRSLNSRLLHSWVVRINPQQVTYILDLPTSVLPSSSVRSTKLEVLLDDAFSVALIFYWASFHILFWCTQINHLNGLFAESEVIGCIQWWHCWQSTNLMCFASSMSSIQPKESMHM